MTLTAAMLPFLSFWPSSLCSDRVGPVLTSIWPTLGRIKRIEGWRGFYKGAIPALLTTVMISIASIIFVGSSVHKGPKGSYTVPEAGAIRTGLFTIVLTLITLPMTVITNRCIITPYLLPFDAKMALRLVLTPDEYAKPWKLYRAPGLLVSVVLHVLWVTLVARSVKWILVSKTDDGSIVSIPLLIIFLIFQLLSSLLLTPLEVIATRLSIQRNSYSPYSRASQSEAGAALPEGIAFAGEAEDVIGLRPEEEPYDGFLDCLMKIKEEEGAVALWRAWWVTALGNLGSAFS